MNALDRSHVHESAILDYIDGGGSARHEVEDHLDVCDECRRLVAELARQATGPWGEGTPTEPRLERALPAPGTLLKGRFRIQRPLGHGAMGMVFEAADEALGGQVAIKVFWPNLSADPRVLDSIRREVSLGRRIVHPNVRRVFDVESSDGVTFLTMELVDGETLEAHLQRETPPPEVAVRILSQICDALGAAHAAGIVHRDLKPGNIALDEKGRVIVMDFGLARDVNAQVSRHQGRGLVGTPAYWSPEQSRGEPATSVSDVYSLGLIAYRLFAGRSFTLEGANLVPPPYRAVVDRCLEQKPQARYPSAAAVKRALERVSGAKGRFVRGAAAVAMLSLAVAIVSAVTLSRGTSMAASAPLIAARATEAPFVDLPSTGEAAGARHLDAPALEQPAVSVADLPSAKGKPRVRAQRVLDARGEPSPSTAEAAPPTHTNETGESLRQKPVRPKRPIDREDPYASKP